MNETVCQVGPAIRFGRVNNSVKCGFRTSKTQGSRLEQVGVSKWLVNWLLVPFKLSYEAEAMQGAGSFRETRKDARWNRARLTPAREIYSAR